MRKLILLFALATINTTVFAYNQELDTLLTILDRTIDQKRLYTAQKEQAIHLLRDEFHAETDSDRKMERAKLVALEFLPYKTDSALFYIVKMAHLAKEHGDNRRLIEARIDKARIQCMMGMLKESSYLLDQLATEGIPDNLKQQYLYCRLSVSNALRDFAINGTDKAHYEKIADSYRDTLLQNYQSALTNKLFVYTEQLIKHKKFNKALTELKTIYETYEYDQRDAGIIAYSIAMVYRDKGDVHQEAVYLSRSAIADIKAGIKDYVSLRKLATLIYETGDIERAYKYMKCSMEDAIFCNARMRTLEAADMFVVIDKSYQKQEQTRRYQLTMFLLAAGLLSVSLLFAMFYIRRQNQKLIKAKNSLSTANDKLSETNFALKDSNRIKEKYIGLYMKQYSDNLVKMNALKIKIDNSINRDSSVASVQQIINLYLSPDNELKEFYAKFDAAILHLFPNFANEFDELLQPGERGVYSDTSESLSPELRIFALIRLGITDSPKIAQFLDYSLSTVYNYRTRMRNKALGDRDEFEAKVMGIGS